MQRFGERLFERSQPPAERRQSGYGACRCATLTGGRRSLLADARDAIARLCASFAHTQGSNCHAGGRALRPVAGPTRAHQ